MSRAIERYLNRLEVPQGKTIVITGGNSGIGFETARHLCKFHWKIFLAVRNMKRGEDARQMLLGEYPDADIELLTLDLNDVDSIHHFAQEIIDRKLDIDVFYANAGIYRVPFAKSFYDLESHMAVNCVANVILYRLLAPYFHSMNHQVKWILTSSIVARFPQLKPTDLYGEAHYKKARAYNKSKLAINHFFLTMCEQEKGTNILPLLVHPGITYTPLIAKAYKGKGFALAANRFLRLFFHTPRKASLGAIYLLQDKVDRPLFVGPRGVGHLSGYPKIQKLYRGNLKNHPEIERAINDAIKEK